MNNLDIYEKVRAVPAEAQKSIGGGRLKGMTDINPMWRIKALTEQFGPCGFGWKYEIAKQWTEVTTPEETAAFVNINLYVRHNGEWSEAIPGTGGSSLLTMEKNGLYTNDECYKMALTDAISVACKALGFGADIYWAKDNTKYNDAKKENTPPPPEYKCEDCGKPFKPLEWKGKSYTAQDGYNISKRDNGMALCIACAKKAKEAHSDYVSENINTGGESA
jgi:hypothetical protein